MTSIQKHHLWFIALLVMMVQSSQLLEPFEVIAAGHGTTATHSIFYELCSLEYRSIHYKKHCNGANSSLDKQYLSEYYHFKHEIKDPDELYEVIKRGTDNIISLLREGEVKAIVDSPVAYIFDDLLKSSPNAKIILSVRDPIIWSKKRHEDHAHNILFCRERMMDFLREEELKYQTKNKNTTNNVNILKSFKNEYYMNPLPFLSHAFSFKTCAERALVKKQIDLKRRSQAGGTTTKPEAELNSGEYERGSALMSLPHLVDIAIKQTSLHELTNISGVELSEKALARAYVEYNEYIKSVVPAERLLIVDLWKQNACEFHDRIENLLGNGKTIAKEWRGSIVGYKIGDELGDRKSLECSSSHSTSKPID